VHGVMASHPCDFKAKQELALINALGIPCAQSWTAVLTTMEEATCLPAQHDKRHDARHRSRHADFELDAQFGVGRCLNMPWTPFVVCLPFYYPEPVHHTSQHLVCDSVHIG
jgi:hypothetical protein